VSVAWLFHIGQLIGADLVEQGMYITVKQITKGETMTAADLQTPARELTLQDRCDSCNAAAKVVATFLNGELLFCGHHARNVKASLQEKSVNIYDPENEIGLIN
jgi:hypothetical protein